MPLTISFMQFLHDQQTSQMQIQNVVRAGQATFNLSF